MQTRGDRHVKGIDVSKWQGAIDWKKVKDGGIQFVIIKATEGTSYIDPNFKQNVIGARAAGLKVGVYHYAHPKNDPQKEVDHFLKASTDIEIDLPPALDLEVNDGLNKAQVTAFALKWLMVMESRIGRKPLFYSYTSFIRSFIGPELATWPLWIAHYDVMRPGANGIWDTWQVFQYSSKGSVKGINGNVDMNVMEASYFAQFQGGEAIPGEKEMEEYMMSIEDANKIIRFISAAYYVVEKNEEAKNEFHRLANELRKASGQKTD